jgi:uncharacterized protein with HEPN domain
VPRRDWRLRVADMVGAAETAMSLTNGLEKAEFLADRTLVDAAIKNVSVLGEAATHIPDEVVQRWPDVPWRMMRDMRNLIIHECFGVNPDIVWGTINETCPSSLPSCVSSYRARDQSRTDADRALLRPLLLEMGYLAEGAAALAVRLGGTR